VSKQIYVAVAAIINMQQQVLLGLRQTYQHQGDLWEFPGGKVELNETTYDTLLREIEEEVGLQITVAEPLIKVSHDYSDKSVILDVWLVKGYSGVPVGQEGQRLRWCDIADLEDNDFPAANVAIIQALKLRVK